MPLVLDASVVATWAFVDESSALASAARQQVHVQQTLAPGLWWYEVANVLVMNERRGRIGGETTAEFLRLLARLPIVIDQAPDTANIVTLARIYRLTIYDAAYLELAHRRGARLATLDRALVRAAEAAGVTLFNP
jgi:predicted nucleic acid-binding protein